MSKSNQAYKRNAPYLASPNKRYSIIAQRGDQFVASALLIKFNYGGPHDGAVLDIASKTLFQTFNVHSIFARGYWYDPTPDNIAKGDQILYEINDSRTRPPS